jgi:hypothetical protein
MDIASPKFRRLFSNFNNLISKKIGIFKVTVFTVRLITKTSIYWKKDADVLYVTEAVGILQKQLYFARKENGKTETKIV